MRANERRGVPVSRRRAFRHGNVAHLERILEDIVSAEQKASQATATTRQVGMMFIAMESLYSMDGDLAPLPQIIAALEKLQMRYPSLVNPARVCVVIDEAHTTGVYGSQGKGFVYDMVEREKAERGGQSRIAEWVQVRLMTFGKGMGSQGGKLGLCCQSYECLPDASTLAVLLASPTIRSFLINYARPFIFSTAMSVVNVLAIESAFDVVESDEGEQASTSSVSLPDPFTDAFSLFQRRQALLKLANKLNTHIANLLEFLPPDARHLVSSLPPPPSPYSRPSRDPTPICPLLTPHPHALALHLQARGYLVRPVVHPTVPKGQERIRICLHSGNSEDDVRRMVECIGEWTQEKLTGPAKAKL